MNSSSNTDSSQSAVAAFFKQFEADGFSYNAENSSLKEFGRLRQHKKWNKAEASLYRTQFSNAVLCAAKQRLSRGDAARMLVVEYELLSAEDCAKLTNSQLLKLLQDKLFVNIHDYADGNTKKFKTFQEFKKDVKNRPFPLKLAKKDPIMKVLLRQVH